MTSRSPAPDYSNSPAPISVAPIPATKKHGRPPTGCPLSQAQRDTRYRAKRALLRAAQAARAAGLDPLAILR